MEATQKTREYVEEARKQQDGVMDLDASATEARLEKTVRDLQARVAQQRADLGKLRSEARFDIETAAYASEDPRQRLKQLTAVKDAYQRLKPTATYLPSPDSVLPALLASRTLQQNVQGSKQALATTQQRNTDAETSLRREEANLQDAKLLTQAMEKRITRLQAQHEDRSQKTPTQLAREVIVARRAQKDKFDEEMQRLGGAMNEFINDYLSSMLAAEELGGPVVGDMLAVEDETLASGFTKKGRPKSSKKPVSDKSRQQRIDQIWGSVAGAAVTVEEEEPPTEAEAADAEMRQLLSNLFATLNGPGGGKAYFQLERDSAASRFLVRANIAQFHPRDARRLRLIDFGRELDD
ncbi:hypothetical protein ACN47E_004160 [Coniothyrium glycines]